MRMTIDELRAFLASIPAEHGVYEHLTLEDLAHRAPDGDPLEDADERAYVGAAGEMVAWLESPDSALAQACAAEARRRDYWAAQDRLNSHTPKTPVREFYRF